MEQTVLTEKELRRLRRPELLALLLDEMKENEALRAELARKEEALARRELDLEEAGSLAEAALRLSGVFQSAQEAADLYLAGVRRLAERRTAEAGGPAPEEAGGAPC